MKILSVFGTRPEAIKMAPVLEHLAKAQGVTARVCVTAQHRHLLDPVLDLFGIRPSYDLNLMKPGQDLTDITVGVLKGLKGVLRGFKPDLVLVQGDTTTMMAAALAAFYEKIPVGHVEAGLRTQNLHAPWPEEMNRQVASRLAVLHFAPTAAARSNLLWEGVDPKTVHVTGNTVIDALWMAAARLKKNPGLQAKLDRKFSFLDPERNPGRVVTRDTLIDRVWGMDYVGDTKTLDVHIKRLRSRIEQDPSKPVLITTIRGLGYRFEVPAALIPL